MSTTFPGAMLQESPKVVTRQEFAASVKAAEKEGLRFNPCTVAQCSSVGKRVDVPFDVEEAADSYAAVDTLYTLLHGQDGLEDEVGALFALRRKFGIALEALAHGTSYHAQTPLGKEQRTKRAQAKRLLAERQNKPLTIRIGN